VLLISFGAAERLIGTFRDLVDICWLAVGAIRADLRVLVMEMEEIEGKECLSR